MASSTTSPIASSSSTIPVASSSTTAVEASSTPVASTTSSWGIISVALADRFLVDDPLCFFIDDPRRLLIDHPCRIFDDDSCLRVLIGHHHRKDYVKADLDQDVLVQDVQVDLVQNV
ncbi:hypothetical protein RQP46_011030 [Phenoliferia psychrophenolica]